MQIDRGRDRYRETLPFLRDGYGTGLPEPLFAYSTVLSLINQPIKSKRKLNLR